MSERIQLVQTVRTPQAFELARDDDAFEADDTSPFVRNVVAVEAPPPLSIWALVLAYSFVAAVGAAVTWWALGGVQ